ncbi:sulfurtransferase [Agrilutibacter solisilvae]|uniref:Sulfurtransferase n=1 Tax=Agrilutibacter solisilvae TaxID=2763317 RepID=A0A974XWV6_9GAMM|nr:sulfurtransferase [Lysobacter solisilvae]QSX77297.1 sulfurtransferase [Lysobacter solisilvae]
MVWNTLVQAETLSVALSRPDVVVLDCRFSILAPAAGEDAYQQSHVPGAFYAHLERDLSDMSRRGQGEGRHPFPNAQDFTARLSRWGITPQHHVVAYDDGDGAQAARLWFLMRLLGHEKVAVLDGGWARWKAQMLPTTHEIPRATPARYAGQFDARRLLDAQQVQAHLAANELLVDARGADRFRGENEMIDPVAGHVPGAVSRPFVQNLRDGRFKPVAELADEFRALLQGRSPDQLVAMCGSGVTACHHILAMERAGLKGARLYTGSWSGWIEDPRRPVARDVESVD